MCLCRFCAMFVLCVVLLYCPMLFDFIRLCSTGGRPALDRRWTMLDRRLTKVVLDVAVHCSLMVVVARPVLDQCSTMIVRDRPALNVTYPCSTVCGVARWLVGFVFGIALVFHGDSDFCVRVLKMRVWFSLCFVCLCLLKLVPHFCGSLRSSCGFSALSLRLKQSGVPRLRK